MDNLRIAKNGKTYYHIVASKTADETVRLAADELHRWLYRCTGACVPVFSDMCPQRGPEIRIGLGVRDAGFYAHAGIEDLAEEGFLIAGDGEDLYITGRTSRGTLYGVMGFLERYCGVRFLSSQVTHTPKIDVLDVPTARVEEAPAFEYRDAYWTDAFNGAFCFHNRLNSSKADISENQGGKLKFFNFHHSFNDLVPKEVYFKDHPEYFSEINGERIYEKTQLCLSNPDVLRISLERVLGWIEANPNCKVFSMAQSDWPNPCACPECRALDEREGGPSGSIIHFVNRIAEEVERLHPDVLIHTFAYQYTIAPPKTLRPRDNVIVRLCNVGASFSEPMEERAKKPGGEYEKDFCQYLEDWGKITKRLYVWDYVTNFRHYLLPFPNLRALQGNIQTFKRMGVRGVFEQGNFSQGGGGAMAELQAYVQAKLLWNPDVDLEAEIKIFLDSFFGRGGTYIGQYLRLIHQAVEGHDLHIYDDPNAPYYSDELAKQALELFDQALQAEDDPQVRERIQKARLSAEYLYLTRLPLDAPGRNEAIDAFGEKVKSHYISEISERVNLDLNLENMKKSQYGLCRDGWYSLYYRM